MGDHPEAARRYHLRAYVSEQGAVRWQQDVGAKRFVDIFVLRPDGFRFAVTGVASPFLLHDLFGVRFDACGWVVAGRALEFATLDAAVMAGVLKK